MILLCILSCCVTAVLIFRRKVRTFTVRAQYKHERVQETYVELCGGDSLAVLGSHSGSADDLDTLVSGAVATGHVVV